MATVYDIQGFNTTTTLSHLGGTFTETPDILAGGGRLVGNCLRTPSNNDVWNKDSITAANPVTSVLGFAYLYGNRPSAGSGTPVGSITDAGSRQCEWGINTIGQLVVMRSGTVLGTSTRLLDVGIWYYIELKVTVNNSTGSFELRVNGEAWITGSGVDTQQSGNAYANGYRVGQLGGGTTSIGVTRVDDLYYADDWLGDIRVDTLYPSGNGNSSLWVGSDGNSTDNYLLVDETPPNDGTDYVGSPTVGDLDTYAFGDLPVAGTVHAVKVKMRAAKNDAGAKSINAVVRDSGTDYDGASQAVSTSYLYYDELYLTNPATAAAWTDTEVNAAEFGVKVAA